MTSPSSRRRTPLPRGWQTLRRTILHRDGYRCTWIEHGQRCPVTIPPPSHGLEVDHHGNPADHHPDNLRTLCTHHHAQRTSAQANAAKTPRRRPNEPHPGDRTP